MTGAPPKPDVTVVITGNRITTIGRTGEVSIPRDAQVIDATGKFLIPGLWDMHVHALRKERVDYMLPLFVANGITGIRDIGTTADGFASLRQLRQEIAGGIRTGPRILAAGRILDGARPAVPENSLPFANPTEAREAVRILKEGGADFIKVYDGVPRDSYFGIVAEARKLKMPFVGHVPMEITSIEASDAGQKSSEHLGTTLRDCSELEPKSIEERVNAIIRSNDKPNSLSLIPMRIAARTRIELATYSRPKCKQLFARFVRNGTWQVPTLIVKQMTTFVDSANLKNDPRMKYISADTLERWKPENNRFLKYLTPEIIETRKELYKKEVDLVGAMHRAGVKFMAGTDVPGLYMYPGFSLHDELLLLVQAGLTPMEALRTATYNPAAFLGELDSHGTVQRGKVANLVLLYSNPLENIANTKRIAAVVLNGRYLSRDNLDGLLADVESRVKAR
jgi:imidazolonepropionase-like amidohydrolase